MIDSSGTNFTTLSQIVHGEFNYETSTISGLDNFQLAKSEYLQLFEGACTSAAKIIGKAQDRESKSRMGSLFKAEGRKKKLTLDARRFTNPIAMGAFTEQGNELFTSVTVTEKQERSTPLKQFHLEGYGAVALKLFLMSAENQELDMHRVITQRSGNSICVTINNSPVLPAIGLPHALELIEHTRAAL
jgi:hypothetical protein